MLITCSVLFTKLNLDFIFIIIKTQTKYPNVPKFITFTNLHKNAQRKNIIINFSKNIHFLPKREKEQIK